MAYLWLRTPYETLKPIRGPIKQVVYATGSTEPVIWARVSPLLPGRVEELLLDENDSVEENQLLAQLDDRVEQERYREIKSRLAYLKNELGRERKLRKQDFTSQQALELKESQFKEAEAQLLSQENVLKRLQVRSPLSGTLLRRDVEMGEYVKPGDILFWVGKRKPLRITADVDEEDIPLVQAGQKVLIKSDAFPNESFTGTVKEITPKGDPINKSFRIRVALPDNTLLRIGMTVEINIIIREVSETLLIPSTALYQGKVWRLEKGSPIPTKLKTGIESPDSIEVISGLSPTDDVIKSPTRYPKLIS